MKQLGFQPELEVWTVWTRSGRSGHGLRCLEPGQKFRKFNPDHFTFFKNLYRTSASRVSLPWLEIGSGRSGNGVRCLEPGQKFRIFNSDHFTFLKNFNPTSGSKVYFFAQKNTSPRGGGQLSIVNQSPSSITFRNEKWQVCVGWGWRFANEHRFCTDFQYLL